MSSNLTDRHTGYPSIDKPWLKYYSEEAINASLPECTIYECLYENNKDYPSDIAINYLGRKITYGELFENIDKTAAAFLKAGVKAKEIVTVALPSVPEVLYCVYALNKIGAVANMIHPLAGKDETLFYFNEVQSRIAVIFDGAYETIANEIEKSSVEKVIVVSPADSMSFALRIAYKLKVKTPQLDGKVFQSWRSFIEDGKGTHIKTVNKDCRDIAIISHTGGTTGDPKGCMLSDYNYNAEVSQIVTTIHYERQESFLAVLPPFVNYSLVHSMIGAVNSGLISVLLPRYEPLKLVKYIQKYHIDHINSIPAYCEALLQIKNIEKHQFPNFGYLFYGGEAMQEEIENQINAIMQKCCFKHKLQKGLGMTELTGAATKTLDEVNEIGSVGIPLPKMVCKIISTESGEELQYGQEGEVCIAGPTLMLGYYKNEDETKKIIKKHKDGKIWIHTGDLGYIDENGELFITGRIKRLIVTKGKDQQATKLFPDRIEKVLAMHQAVELCCVIGVPDSERIHYPKAFIVVKEKTNTERIKKELLEICEQNLPEYMIPDEIEFVDDMPRTPRGKIDYRALENTQKKYLTGGERQ